MELTRRDKREVRTYIPQGDHATPGYHPHCMIHAVIIYGVGGMVTA